MHARPGFRLLLEVALDLVGGACPRAVGIGAGTAERVALSQLIPQLVQSHLQALEPGPLLRTQPVRVLPEPVLLLHQCADPGSDLAVIHAPILARLVDHRQIEWRAVVQSGPSYGVADRAHGVPNTVDTQFGIASGVKGMTALAVVSLVEDGVLDKCTTARSVLGDDLPLIGPEVTVEHLLTHRSGIGDYFDEDAVGDVNAYVLPVSVHELAETEQFLRVLDGSPSKFAPGEWFSYCNGGYVVLALIAEPSSGTPYHQLVRERVCEKAGLPDTDFLRSDELDARAARGYLAVDGPRTNIFHLPVVANGDGGIYSTAADIHSMWAALVGGHCAAGLVRCDGAAPKRRAGRVDALRHGVLATRVRAGGDPGGLRRRGLLPHRARSGCAGHLHGAVQPGRGRLADRPPPRRTAHRLSPVCSGSCVAGSVRCTT